nr:translation initiation factor IF-2-like [Saimiri boliviensis boliviensis]
MSGTYIRGARGRLRISFAGNETAVPFRPRSPSHVSAVESRGDEPGKPASPPLQCRRLAEPRTRSFLLGPVAEGGPGLPCTTSPRSPGGRSAPANMIQNRASALAPAPGASERGLAASAPSEPCGPRARAGREPPRQDPLLTPGPCRPGSSRAEGLPPGPRAHGPCLQRQDCTAGSAVGFEPGTRGALRSACRTPRPHPNRTGPGASPARPEPQPYCPLPPHYPSALGRESGTGAEERRRVGPPGSSRVRFLMCAAVWRPASSVFMAIFC